jgi:hypothetical protein
MADLLIRLEDEARGGDAGIRSTFGLVIGEYARVCSDPALQP